MESGLDCDCEYLSRSRRTSADSPKRTHWQYSFAQYAVSWTNCSCQGLRVGLEVWADASWIPTYSPAEVVESCHCGEGKIVKDE